MMTAGRGIASVLVLTGMLAAGWQIIGPEPAELIFVYIPSDANNQCIDPE